MAAKRKKKEVSMDILIEENEVLKSLKERFFKLYKKEDIGKTPQLTATLDKIQSAILNKIEELKNV